MSNDIFTQKPEAINLADDIGPDSNYYESIFDKSFPNEINKDRITDIFEILQINERNDLVDELEKYVMLKVCLTWFQWTWTHIEFIMYSLFQNERTHIEVPCVENVRNFNMMPMQFVISFKVSNSEFIVSFAKNLCWHNTEIFSQFAI